MEIGPTGDITGKGASALLETIKRQIGDPLHPHPQVPSRAWRMCAGS